MKDMWIAVSMDICCFLVSVQQALRGGRVGITADCPSQFTDFETLVSTEEFQAIQERTRQAKELEENAKKDATFTFEITKTDDNTKWYRAIYIRAGAKSGKAEILSGLPKGQYNIRELSTIRYKILR